MVVHGLGKCVSCTQQTQPRGPQTSPRPHAQRAGQGEHSGQTGQHANHPDAGGFLAEFKARQIVEVGHRDRCALMNARREKVGHGLSQLAHLLAEGAVPPVAGAGQIGQRLVRGDGGREETPLPDRSLLAGELGVELLPHRLDGAAHFALHGEMLRGEIRLLSGRGEFRMVAVERVEQFAAALLRFARGLASRRHEFRPRRRGVKRLDRHVQQRRHHEDEQDPRGPQSRRGSGGAACDGVDGHCERDPKQPVGEHHREREHEPRAGVTRSAEETRRQCRKRGERQHGQSTGQGAARDPTPRRDAPGQGQPQRAGFAVTRHQVIHQREEEQRVKPDEHEREVKAPGHQMRRVLQLGAGVSGRGKFPEHDGLVVGREVGLAGGQQRQRCGRQHCGRAAPGDGFRVHRLLSEMMAKLCLELFGVQRELGGDFAMTLGQSRAIPEAVGERGGEEGEQHPRGAFACQQPEFEVEKMRGHAQFGFSLGATSSRAVHAPAAQRNSTTKPGVAARSAWVGGGGS